MIESAAPVSDREILALEKKYGFKLPQQYRAFLLSSNGGRPERTHTRFLDFHGPYTDPIVDWFLAVKGEEHNDFESDYIVYKSNRRDYPFWSSNVHDTPDIVKRRLSQIGAVVPVAAHPHAQRASPDQDEAPQPRRQASSGSSGL
jgi:hypothetical protein